MKTVEQIANEIIAEMPDLTYDDALTMAEMEVRARAIPHYELAEEKKERKPREKKIDVAKESMINDLYLDISNAIGGLFADATDITIDNADRDISFTYNGERYTLTLTKHRAKKP